MSSTPARYALLIGIDYYMPNLLPDGGFYPNLSGCVRDINHVEDFLKNRLGMTQANIIKLTSSKGGDNNRPLEPEEQWPTYKNMVAAFKKITDMASKDDQVYIHCSSHGGRSKTLFPELKTSGLDESLVPTDIGNSEANYLRDVEIAYLLKAMIDKELMVTVVFDSCHSGGETRGRGGAVARGIDKIDTRDFSSESVVAPLAELMATWKEITGEVSGMRAVKPASGWFNSKGYVFFAACRANESAYEFPFNDVESNGALTYWLLDSLKDMGPGLTYKQLHNRIFAKIHSQFELQTPQLQGEGDREVFGSDIVQMPMAAIVMQVDLANKNLMINVGDTHGVEETAQFAIYPRATIDFTDIDQRVAIVEIDRLGATESKAKIVSELKDINTIEPGDHAVLINVGKIKIQRLVKIFSRAEADLLSIEKQNEALDKVRTELKQNVGFIREASEDEPAEFQVTVNHLAEYEIWDSAGNIIINLRPAVKIDDSDAARTVINRLTHLTKYRNVQELDNRDPLSPLARKLVVEIIGWDTKDFNPSHRPNPKMFDDNGHTPTVNEGDWIFVRIKNKTSNKVLNITALDLQPDWAIKQILPFSETDDDLFVPLEVGEEIVLPLQTSLPNSYEKGTDLIKVFATMGAPNFRWLELPNLDKPRAINNAKDINEAPDPLDILLSTVAEDKPKHRNLNPATFPSRQWVMAQVEINIVKPDAENR